ncbi:MAG: S8/S53 family peptidase [Clostridia bacterium]|nr:S8/S53 family peptidase [Clostridia bacterium]
MTKKAKNLSIVLVAIIVAAVFALPFCQADVAYAQSFGGVEYNTLWYYDELNLDLAKQVIAGWDLSKVKEPIVIACIDTGINTAHELFDGVIATDKDGGNGYNVAKNSTNIADELDYHGTRVAGVMAMLIKELGLQDYIKIYPIKTNEVKNVDGKQRATFSSANVTKAIDLAVGDKVKASVINMSFASSGEDWNTTESLQTAYQNAVKTTVLVAASGNGDGRNVTTGIDSARTPFYPAASEYVLGVMGYNDEDKIYSSSNYGDKYDIAVPEREIRTAGNSNPNYTTFNGTSAGAPFVSVAAALLKLRYIVEGKFSVANGVQNPTGLGFSSMLSILNSKQVTKGDDKFGTLDIGLVLTQDFGEAGNYHSPTAIVVTHDGEYGTGTYEHTIFQYADAISNVTFTAKVYPLAKTNPALDETIEWYIKDVSNAVEPENENSDDEQAAQKTEEEIIQETYGKLSGNGTTFTFTAPHGGDFEIRALLRYGNKYLNAMYSVHVEYLPYYPGEVRVTLDGDQADGVDDAPASCEIYANKTVLLGLTGIEYVDQTVQIKWYVNGEEVKVNGETYSGTTFNFAPKKAGTYVISAKYGDRAVIKGEYTFTVTAKSVMTNPTNIALVAVAGAMVLGGATAAVLLMLKKKKAVPVEQPQEANSEEE